MRRILLTTFGSYGDLHPYIGMAKVLKAHGYGVTIATHSEYQEQVERIGADFVPVKPGLEELGPQENWSAKANNPVRGTEFIIRTLILPYLEDSYKAIEAGAQGHDLIISHVLCFAVPMVAEKLGIPWISTALQPAVFFSAHDPPALGFLTFLPRIKVFGPRIVRLLLKLLAMPTRPWLRPLDDFRKREGFGPETRNVLVDGFSPFGTLALFSKEFTSSKPDWPRNTSQVGFPLFDEETTSELSPGLRKFLDAGEAPIVFTLGTAIVMMATPYYEVAYQAVKKLGLRAVFLVGKKPSRIPPAATTDSSIHLSEYEPFSKLFPKAAVVVHQCGVGTTAQALASGRPQILVPFAHDQPDNARRVVELGCGVSIPAGRLNTRRLVSALKQVTQSGQFALNAKAIAERLDVEQFESRFLQAISHYLDGRNATE